MRDKQNNNYLWIMAVLFVLLALSFVLDLWGKKRDVIEHPLVGPQYFTKAPVRKPRLEPVMEKDGYTYRCSDCHSVLEPSAVQKSIISAHDDIVLEHGVNNYCSTCHSSHDTEKLIDINKNDILFFQSHLTCLQCHGPIYRDWEKGVHGRINDYWDNKKGEVRRLTCIACHDPHQPEFQSMEPSPPPRIENYKRVLDKFTIKGESHE